MAYIMSHMGWPHLRMSTTFFIFYYSVSKMATIAEWAIVAVVALVFLALLAQLVRTWRSASRVVRACPAGKPCGGTPPSPETILEGVQPYPSQDDVDDLGCPSGGFGCAFSDSLFSGAAECGPSCTCARCRDTVYAGGTRGGKQAVRSCGSLIDVDDALRSDDAIMLFWAEGCGPCSAFKPTFNSSALKASIPFYAVEYSEVPEVVDRFQLKGFPTVYRFRGGQWHSEYNGNRTEADFLAWTRS